MFTGRRYDSESGLYYYRARYYDYYTGRFLQPDPIGYDDGLNVYAYVGNSPLILVDPFGLCKGGLSGYERAKIAFLSGVSDAIDWWYKKSGGKEMEKFLWEGRHVGTQYGEQALDYYAQEIAFGEGRWYHYLGGTVSSMWQPDTWKVTTGTIAVAGLVAKPASKTPPWLGAVRFHPGHAGGPHQFPHLQIMIRVARHVTKHIYVPPYTPIPF
jgi:RHS repeat-associated protein